MNLIIEGEPKEIAELIFAVQGRRCEAILNHSVGALTEQERAKLARGIEELFLDVASRKGGTCGMEIAHIIETAASAVAAVCDVILLAAGLARTVGRIVDVFELIAEQLNLISQQVDAVGEGIQGIQ